MDAVNNLASLAAWGGGVVLFFALIYLAVGWRAKAAAPGELNLLPNWVARFRRPLRRVAATGAAVSLVGLVVLGALFLLGYESN